MGIAGRVGIGLFLWVVAGAGAESSFGQTQPDGAATKAAETAPSHKPTLDDLLSAEPVAFDFSDAPITDIMSYMEKSYSLTVMNSFDLKDRVTMKLSGKLKAKEAISILKETLLPLGYTALESVRGDPPHVFLTIVATKRDAGTMLPVFHGMDPEKIPANDELRTQVMTLSNLDPSKAREVVASVMGKRADITVNVETKTLILTDTSANIKRAASLLQVLEQQAADSKK